MPSAWITHCKAVYAAGKKKNASYKYSQAMKDAKSTYKKKGGKAAKADDEKVEQAPKKSRRKKKKQQSDAVIASKASLSRKFADEKVAHTKGLGNVEEGRIAEAKPKAKKRRRKRPVLGKAFRNVN